jgi:hypothetical protein
MAVLISLLFIDNIIIGIGVRVTTGVCHGSSIMRDLQRQPLPMCSRSC